MAMQELIKSYSERKQAIRKRLKEFEQPKAELEIMQELVFCLLTPQSKATSCWLSVERLTKSNLIYSGSEKEIRKNLICRFPNNKARYVMEARERFPEIRDSINNLKESPLELRQWLVKNVKGYGFKEASHFMRNIGLGQDIAILDRHIIKNLKKYNAIKSVPKTLTPKIYMEIEAQMKSFSRKIKIPMDELDLLLWSEEAGRIFK